MSNETTRRKEPPQIVKLDKALKLAEGWVRNMTEAAEDEPTKPDSEGRPYRLGLGAKAPCHIKRGSSDDPIERKLQAKLGSKARKAAKTGSDSTASAKSIGKNGNDGDDGSSDDGEESKAQAFGKKRVALRGSMK